MTVDLEKIKKERLAKKMTQKDMADKLGWKSRTPYAKRENGFVLLGADELLEIVLALGYTRDDLSLFFKF